MSIQVKKEGLPNSEAFSKESLRFNSNWIILIVFLGMIIFKLIKSVRN